MIRPRISAPIASIAFALTSVTLAGGLLVGSALCEAGELPSGATANGATAVDFDTDVMPIFSKYGCNAAACHGGAAGRGGFRLSLFGGDPALDYRHLVYQFRGRRINLVAPLDSLLVAKPTSELEHGGDQRFAAASEPALILQRWIAEGAERNSTRRLVELDVEPQRVTLESLPLSDLQLAVTARFDDGTSRDVTGIATYRLSNDGATAVTPAGRVSVHEGGQHAIFVRFLDHVQVVSIVAPLHPSRPQVPPPQRLNWIDDEINQTLDALGLTAAPLCSDQQFVRRVYLDLIGRLPERRQAEAFVADADLDKRTRLVDRLLQSDAFVDHWTFHLTRQLRLQPVGRDGDAMRAVIAWVRQQLENEAGWDQMARQIILATGDTRQVGPAAIHRLFGNGREEAEYVSEVLLGVRLRCANCHNHPLDQWTQDDYHGLAQIFATLERGVTITVSDTGAVINPRTGQPARARLPGDRYLDLDDPRPELARWMTADENPYFAKAMVGRIWKQLIGRGLVEPVDDLRVTNPPTHPSMWDRLAGHFRDNQYQLRPTIALICNSAAYQRQVDWSDTMTAEKRVGAAAMARPLPAEVLIALWTDLLEPPTTDPEAAGPTDANAAMESMMAPMSMRGRANDSPVAQLGGCDVPQGCEQQAGAPVALAAKLYLLNGPVLNRPITSADSALARMVQRGDTTSEIVSHFYHAALTRAPRAGELSFWLQQLQPSSPQDRSGDADEREERLRDFVWSLLNCSEFVTNH